MSRAYYILSGAKSPKKALKELTALGADALAAELVNDVLNRLISEYDNADIFTALAGHCGETAVPYQGWYWRSVNFFSPHGVTIARGDGQVAVCENNKWDYPSRFLTDDERAEFLALFWAAYKASREGGRLSDIQANTLTALVKAGEFIRNLDVKDDA